MRKLLLVLAAVSVVVAAVPAAAQSPQNIVDTAASAGKFSTLLSLAKKAGLAGTLANGGPFTVFAPTNAAFAKVPRKTLRALEKNKKALRAVLLYHVLKGRVTSDKIVMRRSAKTLNGARVKFRVVDGKVFVNNARVTQADIGATNGVIHVINRVLIPPMG